MHQVRGEARDPGPSQASSAEIPWGRVWDWGERSARIDRGAALWQARVDRSCERRHGQGGPVAGGGPAGPEALPARRLVGVGSARPASEKTALPDSLGGGRPPGSTVRREVERVDEPALVANKCPETARLLLRMSESLEVIVDKRFADGREPAEHEAVQEQTVAAQPGDPPGDRCGGAPERTGCGAVGGARDKGRGDLCAQLGPLEVVRNRETLPGERAPAAQAEEAGYGKRLAACPVGPVPAVAETVG